MYKLPIINAKAEKEKIVLFLKKTLKEQRIKNVIIGLSGGIDSTVCFHLLKEAVQPKNIFVAHLYYFESKLLDLTAILKKADIPNENVYKLSIKDEVDQFKRALNAKEKIRLGNIMARVRMTMLYDLAKKHNALVLGTEDKSEYLLGYFTRFGDQASDIEPIRHLYKTQVYELAKYLGIPSEIIKKNPSPGLWINHSAEEELGFSYQEADLILHLYFDKRLPIEEIKKMGLPKTEKVINSALQNGFKHRVPYTIK